MMEDGLPLAAQNLGGQVGNAAGGINLGIKQNHEEHNQRVQYSIPGILHFIQHEWARFEMERSQWEVERAELQARVAFLQGERKGQENLKNDLVRRIKMLEYALKQERGKYHKLKYGTELNQGEIKAPSFEEMNRDEPIDGETMLTSNSNNVTWRQGRQLLRQYLQEIGYTDTIIDVRSARVRSLLGITSMNEENVDNYQKIPVVNGERISERREQYKKIIPPSIAEGAVTDSEASVLATFDFLGSENIEMDEDDANLSGDDSSPDEEADERIENKWKKNKSGKRGVGNDTTPGMDDVMADADTEEVLSEFAFLGSESGEGAGEARSQGDTNAWDRRGELSTGEEWGVTPQLICQLKDQYRKEQKNKKCNLLRPKRSHRQIMLAALDSDEEFLSGSTSTGNSTASNMADLESSGIQGTPRLLYACGPPVYLGERGADNEALGELARIAVNESEVSCKLLTGNEPKQRNTLQSCREIPATTEAYRKTWNAKYTLRSHFDGVRALAFHPVEPVLITASEDHTLKLWNLQKTVPAKKTASLDVEPVYTFRAHVGPVLCLAMSATGEQCFSGGMDSTIRCWTIPSSNIDPYDSFDPGVLTDTLTSHSDSVWGLAIHSSKTQLLSCSADGTVRLWAPQNKTTLLNTYVVDTGDGAPTSVDFVRCDPAQMVTAFSSSNCIIYDLETGKPVVQFDNSQNTEMNAYSKQINRVVSHPTLPVTITAHEDRHIRFFDNISGKMIHSMVAHLDAVTCLAIDPNGLYLLSGSHDCSIRLWSLDNKSCVQEITSHRKKFDESIFDVAFHPSKPFIASAGADALAKVFV